MKVCYEYAAAKISATGLMRTPSALSEGLLVKRETVIQSRGDESMLRDQMIGEGKDRL